MTTKANYKHLHNITNATLVVNTAALVIGGTSIMTIDVVDWVIKTALTLFSGSSFILVMYYFFSFKDSKKDDSSQGIGFGAKIVSVTSVAFTIVGIVLMIWLVLAELSSAT